MRTHLAEFFKNKNITLFGYYFLFLVFKNKLKLRTFREQIKIVFTYDHEIHEIKNNNDPK